MNNWRYRQFYSPWFEGCGVPVFSGLSALFLIACIAHGLLNDPKAIGRPWSFVMFLGVPALLYGAVVARFAYRETTERK